MAKPKKKKVFKVGDEVLVKSFAGPQIHVRLTEKVVVEPSKGNTMDWPGYSGFKAVPLYQHELEILKKHGVPAGQVEDYDGKEKHTWVFDYHIIKKAK